MKKSMMLATDATVIMSAVLGGQGALKIFKAKEVCRVTTSFNVGEVKKHLPKLAKKYRLNLEALQTQLDLLLKNAYDEKTHETYVGLTVYEEDAYSDSIEDAKKRIEFRDPKDVPLLALALKLQIPVWSNDKDFESAGIEWYTTSKLIEHLKI